MGCCQGKETGAAADDRAEPLVDTGRGGTSAKNAKSYNSGRPAGTKWDEIQKDREQYGDVEGDLPELPFNKQKEVNAEIDMQVKKSKYLTEFKREFRDALRRKKAKGHEPRLFRLYDKSLHPADEAAGKTEDRRALRERLVDELMPAVEDDLVDGFKEDGLKGSDKEHKAKARTQMRKLVHERLHDVVHFWAERTFKKDRQGKDADESDDDQDDAVEDDRAKKREERKRQIMAEREREAAEWEAERQKSPSAGRQPPPLTAPKKRGGPAKQCDPAFKKKCEDFYKHYCPEKVSTLDEQLAKREGDQKRLDDMFKKMTEKYGPWPPQDGKKGEAAAAAAAPAAAAASPSKKKEPVKKEDAKEAPVQSSAPPAGLTSAKAPAAPDAPTIDDSLKLKGGGGELPAPPAGTHNRDSTSKAGDNLDLKGKSEATQARLKRGNVCVDSARMSTTA